jgi:hypothetical protein
MLKIRTVAGTILFAAMASGAWAAAGPDPVEAPATETPAVSVQPIDYTLDTELVVRNWVLCVARPFAEELVHARETGVDAAVTAFGQLTAAKTCGRLGEMRVILKEPIYQSVPDSGYDARIFSALINIAGDWAAAFVVSGSLPE